LTAHLNILYKKIGPMESANFHTGPNQDRSSGDQIMATAQNTTALSRFHNLPAAALADELGRVDAISKAAEAELKALKDAFKARGLSNVAGDAFTVTATDQVAWRLDMKAVREFLGDASARFESVITSTVIRIKAADRLALAA
jgi:hypothetical protein